MLLGDKCCESSASIHGSSCLNVKYKFYPCAEFKIYVNVETVCIPLDILFVCDFCIPSEFCLFSFLLEGFFPFMITINIHETIFMNISVVVTWSYPYPISLNVSSPTITVKNKQRNKQKTFSFDNNATTAEYPLSSTGLSQFFLHPTKFTEDFALGFCGRNIRHFPTKALCCGRLYVGVLVQMKFFYFFWLYTLSLFTI